MSVVRDLTGNRFGRLVVIGLDHKKNYRRYWLCQCDCGKKAIVREDSLLKYTRSCGCLISEARKSLKGKPLKHGLSRTRIYGIYSGMKQRCYNPNDNGFSLYGGRGIKICDEWLGEDGFVNFHKWALANGYKDNLSIDRINVNGDYEPKNCRWANNSVQRKNQRQKEITINGETHTILEWSKKLNIKYDTLLWRVNHGWKMEDIIVPPT